MTTAIFTDTRRALEQTMRRDALVGVTLVGLIAAFALGVVGGMTLR